MRMRNFCVLLLCLVTRTIANFELFDSDVQLECATKCSMTPKSTETAHYDYACDYNCNVAQCKKGCSLWRIALNSTCQRACNGENDRLTQKSHHCVMGCNDAISKYHVQLKSLLGIPPAPALVADTLRSTSLKLEWNFPLAIKDELSCYVQWKYDDDSIDQWQYCKNVTWTTEDSIVFIQNLHPYTKYRFRIAIAFQGHQDQYRIFSEPSVVISTAASGVPASAPNIVRAAPVDHSSISVSWEPGLFPHGPLLSYVLQITDNHSHSEVKDVPPDNQYYMFHNLRSETSYNISIRMRNREGSGPPASVLVRTLRETAVKNTQQPELILGTANSVIQQEATLTGEPEILYLDRNNNFQGMAIHIRKKLLFISDSSGRILKVNLERDRPQKAQVILDPSNIHFRPLDLTVDWLNDQLYILAEVSANMYQIIRCSLNGKGLTVAIAGLYLKPAFMEVDPCNGYLFWIIQDENKGGLYRLDLADISNGIKHEIQPKMILRNSSLGAFVVDYTNFHILVSYQIQKTIYSVSLDGKEWTDFRSKVTTSRLQKVLSLAYANKKFYWTDGKEIFYEEYHHSYFHNTLGVRSNSYKKVFVDLPSSQPIPVPVNPPTNVQVIFGCTTAKTKWQPPHLLGVQSLRGAWQNWSYEISVTEVPTNKVFTIKDINTTFYTITNLKENTEYIIKAVAYTSDYSPWSSEFRGATLSETKKSMILWSAAEGLLKTNAAGEAVETLISKEKMKYFHFIDITWYKDKIYLVTNNSEVLWLNTTTHTQGTLSDMDSVRSIAVDWIGRKIYWSSPKQQVIFRGNLNGGQKEHVPIYVVAKELNIDPIQAYLYWSTGYAVESSRLNGEGKVIKYQEAQFFHGNQVLGLTLDMDNKNVYWILRGPEGSNLYRAPMAGYFPEEAITSELVYTLQKPNNMQGPLCYFHKRLLWLQDDKNAAISDLTGKNIATVSGKSIWGLSTVYVIDSSLHVIPENITGEINVIPESINGDFIRVIGTSTSFNVTWEPIGNVNFGTVFYEIQIESFNNRNNYSSRVTTNCSINYWQNVEPHVKLHIGVRAYTYWGSSQQVHVEVFSPSSTPSAPINLRTYVIYEYKHNYNHVSITFRWGRPQKPNGEIIGYKIYCWYVENDEEIDLCDSTKVPPGNMEYILTDLVENEIYYLQVQAYTDKGDGVRSEVVAVNSSHVWPLPTLLIASSDSIFIDDMDANHSQSIIHGINTPIEIAYMLKEKKIFWVNQMNELLMLDLLTNKTKNFDIKKLANGVTVDWLERSLYYVETDGNSTLYKINLNLLDKGVKESEPIYTTKSKISKIETSPFTRKLYWVETEDGETFKLMKSNVDGSFSGPFFSEHQIDRRSLDGNGCNCQITNIEPTFTIDHSNVNNKPVLIFIDGAKNIISSDKDGCICNTIADRSIINNYPLERLKSDFGTLYWTNPERNVLHALKRSEHNILSKRVNAHDIMIFGQHMQPYPERDCLGPKQHNEFTVRLVNRTSSSLRIEMPEFEISGNCTGISMATVEYRIFYAQYNGSTPFCSSYTCEEITTFQNLYNLTNLKPFTEYIISVSLSNHFTKDDEILVGPPVIFKTAPGAPSKPQNVSAIVLNPTLAEVNWLPPKELNGLRVYYEIHWQTEASLSGVRQKGEQSVQDLRTKTNTTLLTTSLEKLSPNSTYIIWVKAYSETNETSSDSDRVTITTYSKPSDLKLINQTAYLLKLTWKKSPNMRDYRVEYSPITSNDWQVAQMDRFIGQITVENLKPKMQYKFRLSILYMKYPEWYIWPTDSRFTFETLGDRPSPPGTPNFQYVKLNVYKVAWEAAKENGAPIETYNLEGMKLTVYRKKRSTNRPAYFDTAPSIEEEDRKWESFYNGTNTSWIIEGLSEKFKYSFRVSALNAYGWSLPSKESLQFDLNEAARWTEKQDPSNLILIAIAIPLLIGLCVLFCILYACLSKCGKPKKVQQVVAVPRRPDVELATLRELPRRGVHSTNILYVSTQPTPEELTLLPHIRRDQITLTKFLGSGAFGEVYEGKAKGILDNNRETRVAVKTLRKGASDQEKSEFLQEAELMSHFKHEHILQLLGVCLDNDPHFIIMELMLGGDLLTYLRSSRNPTSSTPSLTLIELLKMCVDVSKGCRYLEEMHFVHRDLACRNCLVSSTDKESRIVKIGDFGLARDIYKNDYYRKEGEGLLPVRWMAPESLVDGVFTSQSDVWAFGVLLWEIMTVGQQPYPARSNLEVLHYVKRGGRLGKPTDCPEDLHNLMLKCWEYVPDKRPTFKFSLGILVSLHQENLRNPVTGVHEGQYISTVPELFQGISNEAYFRDENHNDSGNSWLNDDEANKEKTPFLPDEPTQIPKYLELIYERQNPLENDGYEVPNQILKAKTSSLNSPVREETLRAEKPVVYHNLEKNTTF